MKRKKNNPAARMQRFTRALLRQHAIVVVSVEPSGRQGLLNWKNCKSVAAGELLASGICDIAHHWTIYLAVFCQSQSGDRYIKAAEIIPDGAYRSEQLSAVMEAHHEELAAGCNPAHVIGKGWIASPVGESLNEEQAARVFDAVGVWQEQVAA